jgi:hypothetical protein
MDSSTRPGPMSVEVTCLREKLDLLLGSTGENKVGLASVLRTVPSAISGWCKVGRVPLQKIGDLSGHFGLDASFLVESDYEQLKLFVDRRLTRGTWQRWQALIKSCDPKALGLALQSPLDMTSLGRLRGVVPDRLPHLLELRGKEILESQAPVFELTPKQLQQECAWDPENVVLVLKDRKHLQCLCPSIIRGRFIDTKGRWLFPGPDRDPLSLDSALGEHFAFAIATNGPLPAALCEELAADQMLGDRDTVLHALDGLALWLEGGEERESGAARRSPSIYAIRRVRFTVLPGKTPRI